MELFFKLVVCGQKQQERKFRPYIRGFFHTDWLLCGCQWMDQVQKLKPSWQFFIFAVLSKKYNK